MKLQFVHIVRQLAVILLVSQEKAQSPQSRYRLVEIPVPVGKNVLGITFCYTSHLVADVNTSHASSSNCLIL